MEQPDLNLWLWPYRTTVRLEDADCKSDDKWYQMSPSETESARIEVAPGEHRFFFDGGSIPGRCYFMLSMLQGHVYKVKGLIKEEFLDGIPVTECWDCRHCGCPLEVIDTAPDGNRLTAKVYCGG
jgi:hypothetical protein